MKSNFNENNENDSDKVSNREKKAIKKGGKKEKIRQERRKKILPRREPKSKASRQTFQCLEPLLPVERLALSLHAPAQCVESELKRALVVGPPPHRSA